MRLALLSSFNYHMCCIGFLLELFRDYDIDVFFPDDRERFLEYYKTLYFNMNITLKHVSSFIKSDYDLCIKMTSNDNVISSNEIISIAHIKQHSDNYNKYIIMSPWIKGENNLFYFFPLYRGIKNRIYKDIITYLGFFVKSFLDEDTKNFIKNSNYLFNFFGGDDIPELKDYPNVITGGRIDTFYMVEMIKESKFILIRKEPFQLNDRYSGALGHSISHGKPIIVQKNTSDSYNLPGIVFETNYSEVIDKINNMTEQEYEMHIKDIEEFSEKTIRDNNQTLKRLLALK